jgi:hypothetical protein
MPIRTPRNKLRHKMYSEDGKEYDTNCHSFCHGYSELHLAIGLELELELELGLKLELGFELELELGFELELGCELELELNESSRFSLSHAEVDVVEETEGDLEPGSTALSEGTLALPIPSFLISLKFD